MVEMEVREHVPYNFFEKREPPLYNFNEKNWEILQCYPECVDVLYFYSINKDYYKEKDGKLELVDGGTAITDLQDINVRISLENPAEIVTFDRDSWTIFVPSYRPEAITQFRDIYSDTVNDIAEMFECSSDEVTDRTLFEYCFAHAIGSAIQIIALPDTPPREEISQEIAYSYIRQNRSKFIDLPVYLPKDDSPEEIAKERDGWELFEKHLWDDITTDEHDLIYLAYTGAYKAHKDYNIPRKNGDPYFMHPREVALQLLKVGVRNATVIAGALFHDVKEDTRLIEDHPEDAIVHNDQPLYGKHLEEDVYVDDEESYALDVDLTFFETETFIPLEIPRVYDQEIERLYEGYSYSAGDRLDTMFDERIENIMFYITQDDGESDQEYMKKIAKARKDFFWEVILLKASDNLHNAGTLDSVDIKKQLRKIIQIQKYLKIYKQKLLFDDDVDQETQDDAEKALHWLSEKIEFEIEIRKIFFEAHSRNTLLAFG